MDSVSETGTEPELATLEKRYRQLLLEQFDRLTFKGISRSGKAVSLPLEDVYIDLKAVADVPDAADTYSADERRLLLEAEVRGMPEGDLRRQLDSLRVERWRDESRRGGTRLARRSIAEAVADPSRPGLVILGDPGSGKTTLLHYLALRAAKESAAKASLPIFVPLAAYDDWLRRAHEPLSLRDFLPVYYDKWCCLPGLGPLFQRAFHEGRALVLFDGLDEALDIGTRVHIAGQARALIQGEVGRGNRFVVTSRVVGYREAPLPGDLPHVTVLDFGEPEIAAFAHKWCEACEVWLADGKRTDEALRRATKEEQDLLAEVRANPSVLRLAANPLLLTMLALLKRQGGKLPEERVRLYERYVDTLIDNWEITRSEGARTREASRFDRNLATHYLIELALWLQRFKPSGTAQGRDLELALVEIALRVDGLDPVKASPKDRQQAHEKAALFLKDMRHFAGLLAERGQDAFGFLHLTFQEYFAGRALARTEPEERWAVLKENLHRPRWREPILLCAGQLGIVEGRSKAVSDLGRRILGAKSSHEELLHRDVLLTAAMAADGVGFERGLLDDLAGMLEGLADDGVPAVRTEALRRLAQMTRLAHEGAGRWMEERIRQKVRPRETAQALKEVLGAESCAGLRQAICQWLDEPNHELRCCAIEALKIVASSDTGVKRLLLAKFDDPVERVRLEAFRALGEFASTDGNLRRLILTELDAPNEELHVSTLYALRSAILNDRDIRRIVLKKMDRSSSWVCSFVLQILQPVVSSDEEVLSAVVAMLDDPDKDLRQAAVSTLETRVSSDRQVHRLILAKLDDPATRVRWAAVSVLGTTASRDGEVRRLILTRLDDPDEDVRQAAVSALGTMASRDGEVRRLILTRLDDPAKNVRQAAITTLEAMISSDEEVRRSILHKINDTQPNVRLAATNALKPLMSSDAEVRLLILDRLDHNQWRPVLPQMIDALSGLASIDEEIRRLILAKFDDPDQMVSLAVIHALRPLVPSDAEIRRLVLAKLDNPDQRVREKAVHLLHPLVPSDAEIRHLVLAKLDDPDTSVRYAAFRALQQVEVVLDDGDIEFMRCFTLGDPNESVRQAAGSALQQAEEVPDDEEIRRMSLTKLDDPDEGVRREAVRALRDVVPSDEGIRRLILTKLDDASWDVRHTVIAVMAPQIVEDRELARRLLRWLGMTSEGSLYTDTTRRRLAGFYAPLLTREPELFTQVRSMLESPAWPERQGAAWALIAMPGGPPPEVLPALRGLIGDLRAEESWPERLETAAILINDHDSTISRRAITTAMGALDYATEAWYDRTDQGDSVRSHAAEILGALEPTYRSDEVFTRLTRVLGEDSSGKARDAAYQALLRLAVVPEAEHDLESVLTSPSNPAQRPAAPHSPTPAMSPLPPSLVLHLSDLHFGTAENAATWYSQLAEDLRTELACSRLDAIILSGDLANSSTSEEYAAAQAFVAKLSAEFHLLPNQIIPIPGNHDLNWGLSRKAYKLVERDDLTSPPEEGHFIDIGSGAVRVRDGALYPRRFDPFAAFYQAIRGEPYPLEPDQQALLYPLPAQRLLILGLNSAWDLDHHFRARASIHAQALAHALDRIRAEPAYKDFLKVAVWHHPVQSPFDDRIKDPGFLERLANADFRLGLHGHIHKAQSNLYRYDMNPAGRRLELVCAGTFGAPTRELLPGYPFQYQLLRFEGASLTVETRRREEINGAWKPDARWTAQRGKDPEPRYRLPL